MAEDTTIYVQPDLQPQYPGGYTALWNFINKNLTWPNPDADVDGKVVVQFVVEKDGTLTHKTIVRELEPAFDKEALRIINLLPKWIPAKLNGKPVRSYYKVPITFRLE